MQKQKITIWVYGDSWVDLPYLEQKDNRDTWPFELTRCMAQYDPSNSYSCTTRGMIGCNQDWILDQIRRNDDLQSQDWLVVVLTNHDRWWFYEEYPWVTNGNTYGFGNHLEKEQLEACEYYFRYLHNDELMLQYHFYRLCWLHEFKIRSNLINPVIVINGFNADLLSVSSHFPELVLSHGSLNNVQCMEWLESEPGRIHGNWNGRDVRFNHLCLRNHKILADKIARCSLFKEPLDFTHGFHENFLWFDSYLDDSFVETDLSRAVVEDVKDHLTQSHDPLTSFKNIIKGYKNK